MDDIKFHVTIYHESNYHNIDIIMILTITILYSTQGRSCQKLTSPANLIEKTEMDGTKFNWIYTQCAKHTPKCKA